MSNLKWDIAAALVAFIIATSGFLVMVENAPTQSVNISKDQAIGIIKASSKVDPEKTIAKDEYLTSAELQYLNINWGSYLWSGGSHRRIYVSTTPVGGEFKPYWVLDYEQPLSHVSSSGTYVVDAETGELMLALEDSGGLPTLDFSMTLTPQATQDNPLIVKRGESSSINLTLAALPTYDASLPVSVSVTDIPQGCTIKQNATSPILRTGGKVTVMFSVTVDPSATLSSITQSFEPQAPRFAVEILFIDYMTGTWVYLSNS